MKTTIKIGGIACCGCANSVHRSLSGIAGIFGVNINTFAGEITIDHTDEISAEELYKILESIGLHPSDQPDRSRRGKAAR